MDRRKLFYVVLIAAIFVAQFFLIHKVFADDEGFGGEEEGGEELEDFGKSLGSIALGLAVLFNFGYVVYKTARMAGIKIPVNARFLLNFHIGSNLILGGLAIYHGYLFLNKAGIVEYLLVGAIFLIIISGITLRYFKNRKVKYFSRLIHAQRLISLIILILAIIHMGIVED